MQSESLIPEIRIRMYAIVDVAGQQFKVEKDEKIFVHRLAGNEGDKVEFDQVLLIEDGDKIIIGEPLIEGAIVSGKILSHLKSDKVKVFKKKRRKGYQVLRGHRQQLSQVMIESIIEKGVKKKETVRDEKPKPKQETETAQARTVTDKDKKSPAKKTTAEKITSPKSLTEKKETRKPAGSEKSTAKKTSLVKTDEKKSAPKTEGKTQPAGEKAESEKELKGKPKAKKPAAKSGTAKKAGPAKKTEK